MTLARSSPSCTLDQGFLIIARTSDLGPTAFTMTYLEGGKGPQANPEA
jgi:hypothetical protein